MAHSFPGASSPGRAWDGRDGSRGGRVRTAEAWSSGRCREGGSRLANRGHRRGRHAHHCCRGAVFGSWNQPPERAAYAKDGTSSRTKWTGVIDRASGPACPAGGSVPSHRVEEGRRLTESREGRVIDLGARWSPPTFRQRRGPCTPRWISSTWRVRRGGRRRQWGKGRPGSDSASFHADRGEGRVPQPEAPDFASTSGAIRLQLNYSMEGVMDDLNSIWKIARPGETDIDDPRTDPTVPDGEYEAEIFFSCSPKGGTG